MNVSGCQKGFDAIVSMNVMMQIPSRPSVGIGMTDSGSVLNIGTTAQH